MYWLKVHALFSCHQRARRQNTFVNPKNVVKEQITYVNTNVNKGCVDTYRDAFNLCSVKMSIVEVNYHY